MSVPRVILTVESDALSEDLVAEIVDKINEMAYVAGVEWSERA